MLQYLTEVSAIFKISLHTASYAQAAAGVTGGGAGGGEELKRRKMGGWVGGRVQGAKGGAGR